MHAVYVLVLTAFSNTHVDVHVLNFYQIENEENVLVCLRIIIEQHKQFRPSLSPEVSQ